MALTESRHHLLPLQRQLLAVAALHRSADLLALAGLRQRHQTADAHTLGLLLALQRLNRRNDQPFAAWLAKETQMSDSPADLLQVATRAATICTDLQIPYLIGGGMASTVHGEFRTTRDIDLVIWLKQSSDVSHLMAALTPAFAFHPDDLTSAYQQTHIAMDNRAARGSFSAYDRATGVRLDVHITGHTPFDKSQLERAIPITVAEIGAVLMIASAEDTILTKLEWYAITPSERQWKDVQTILQIQSDTLDLPYITYWAAILHVASLWEAARTFQIAPHQRSSNSSEIDPRQTRMDI